VERFRNVPHERSRRHVRAERTPKMILAPTIIFARHLESCQSGRRLVTSITSFQFPIRTGTSRSHFPVQPPSHNALHVRTNVSSSAFGTFSETYPAASGNATTLCISLNKPPRSSQGSIKIQERHPRVFLGGTIKMARSRSDS